MTRLRRIAAAFDPAERRSLTSLTGAVAGLHVVGITLVIVYTPRYPVLGGLAVLAYTFGLRHAFDADHISAIDNTTRKLLSEGKRPLGAGFFFSLGHSTIVFVLSLGLAIAAGAVHSALPTLQFYGGTIGAAVSGLFLLAIGALNLVVLNGIVAVGRELRAGRYDEQVLEEQLQQRGLMCRFFARPLRLVRSSRDMYPIGILFGLGFDTATEVGLLALTAGAATGKVAPLALISLPILFAAGMSLMDTADGVFMTKAYLWAFSSPVRKLYYNITVTSLSVFVALLIGTIELTQVLSAKLGLTGGFWSWLHGLDFGTLGYAIVALFALTWLVALAIWKWRRIEQRWSPVPSSDA
ncbi:MAG TPA: HoxN/HupN/NixA family nickel/cobalt transporter [Solirubrobacteraceae bacterium]|jgi:high-affinity nickel-transport protein